MFEGVIRDAFWHVETAPVDRDHIKPLLFGCRDVVKARHALFGQNRQNPHFACFHKANDSDMSPVIAWVKPPTV